MSALACWDICLVVYCLLLALAFPWNKVGQVSKKKKKKSYEVTFSQKDALG
jgi:hypothetical protein